MNGMINVLKPPGMSSSGVVVFLRRILGVRRIGHAGTLDPGAAGVLVVLAGRSTRLSDRVMNHKKTYLAEITFGVATDTLDSYGEVTERRDCLVRRQELEAVLPEFLGKIQQVPPLYSAVKIEGRKSYELARKGLAVQKPPREVMIYGLTVREQRGENRFLLEVVCSKGTYIRTLAADLGKRLGVPACLTFLLRSASGGSDVTHAYTVDEIRAMAERGDHSFLQPPEAALGELPALVLGGEWEFALQNGQTLVPSEPVETGEYRLYCREMFYGIGRAEEGTVRLETALY